MDTQGLKLDGQEDRISNLPDSIIHRILSFLPSTKEAIQTSILSKRWQKQWTRVPVLIFDFSGMYYVPSFVDNAIICHDCSKIKKFEIIAQQDFIVDSTFNAKLRFVITKEVEELILNIDGPEKIKLPNFFFNHASLVKLEIMNCDLMPNGRVNWDCLKDLHIKCCTWPNEVIDRVVSGSPVLESLEITCCCWGFDRLVIVSKSLKRLVLGDPYDDDFSLEVSCPNLKEFHAVAYFFNSFSLSSGAIENVVSGSPCLELLELVHCQEIGELVIDSKSLTKLVLLGTPADAIIISCPNLEELNLTSLSTNRITLMNLPSSICATLDFKRTLDDASHGEKNLVMMILEQLHDVKELHIGRCCIQILSVLEMRGLASPSVNSKCLILDGGPNSVKNLPGITYALRSSPELEKLVINLQLSECDRPEDLPLLNVSGENFWNSKETIFNCLVSHLKLVKIIGLSKTGGELNLVFDFVEFLLKNARVLEKMVVILNDCSADFVFDFEVSQKLLSFPKFSQHATIELLRSESSPIYFQSFSLGGR